MSLCMRIGVGDDIIGTLVKYYYQHEAYNDYIRRQRLYTITIL